MQPKAAVELKAKQEADLRAKQDELMVVASDVSLRPRSHCSSPPSLPPMPPSPRTRCCASRIRRSPHCAPKCTRAPPPSPRTPSRQD